MRDRLTAVKVLVDRFGRICEFDCLTRAVDLGHHEASQNRLVEGGIGAAWRWSAHNSAQQRQSRYLRARNLYRRTNSLT
jgi:hypothetical protein